MVSVSSVAQDWLTRWREPPSLEGPWMTAALRSLAEERIVEPSVNELRRLSHSSVAWFGVLDWPQEFVWNRRRVLHATQCLAMCRRDIGWIQDLRSCWRRVEFVPPLLCLLRQGEASTALRAFGCEADSLTTEDLAMLTGGDDPYLNLEFEGGRAWYALFRGSRRDAERSLDEYEAWTAKERAHAMEDPTSLVHLAVQDPDFVIQTQRRALAMLIRLM
jgi:hypothetical protein